MHLRKGSAILDLIIREIQIEIDELKSYFSPHNPTVMYRQGVGAIKRTVGYIILEFRPSTWNLVFAAMVADPERLNPAEASSKIP